MDYLTFQLDEAGEGVAALEAMASTQAGHHAAVMAEVELVLAWCWQQFAHSHGPVDDGQDWHHELRVVDEAGGWRTVTLSIAASPRFTAAFEARFGPLGD